MNFIFTILAVLIIGVGCMQRPIETIRPYNNDTYSVQYLFEHDGCKVYRFIDRGQCVYFTNCWGETISKTDSTQTRNTTNMRSKNK